MSLWAASHDAPGSRGQALRWSVDIVLALVTLGVVGGLGFGLHVVRTQGYLGLGFVRNSVLVLASCTALAAVVAAAYAAVVLILVFGVTWIRTRILPRIEAPLARAASPIPWKSPAWPYAACFAVSLIAAGVIAQRVAPLGPFSMAFLLAGSFAWCALFWLSQRRPHPALRFMLYALPPAVLIAKYRLDMASTVAILRWEAILALVVWAILLFALHRSTRFLARSRGRRAPARAVVSYGVLAMVVLTPLLLSGVAAAPSTARLDASRAKNVLMIIVDTMRWDYVSIGVEGQTSRDITPSLRSLCERGTIFENAISQAPWTMPAVASVMTGLYPRVHGAFTFSSRLRPSEVTLAEVLREAGYETGGVVSHALIGASRGFAQGFGVYNEDNAIDQWAVTSDHVTDEAIRFLEDNMDSRHFLFVHYFDPHYEYRDHAQWGYADGYDGWLLTDRMDIHNLRYNRHQLQPPDLRYLTDLYSEEIAFTDREIGRLLAYLDDHEPSSETVVVFVADHGEEFMEHGWLGHTITLHEEVVRVPMVIVLPDDGDQKRSVGEAVETRRIFDTVLDCVGVEWSGTESGASLVPLMQTGEEASDGSRPAAPVFSESWLPEVELTSGKRVQVSSVRVNDWKLIFDVRRDREYLYNLKEDAGETVNLATTERDRADDLYLLLDAFLEHMSTRAASEERSTDEWMERLRSLGYL